MSPRNLRLLRIDDALERSAGVKTRRRSGLRRLSASDPAGVELVRHSNQSVVGINGWAEALHFWTSFSFEEPIDLVVADVRFDGDRTNPIWKQSIRDLPTGLSHLKPFAALSRASGKPMGICLHTMDPSIWETLATSTASNETQRKIDRILGMYAAQEIGEIAAILSQTGTRDFDAGVDWCWAWLKENSEHEDSAIDIAVHNYRADFVEKTKSVPGPPSIIVPHKEWIRIREWLDGGNSSESCLESEEAYISFSYADGSRDAVLFASIFRDCISNISAELDQFLTQINSLWTEIVEAWGVASSIELDTTSVDENLRSMASEPFRRALVVLLLNLRLDAAEHESWLRKFNSHAWSFEKNEFELWHDETSSLAKYLTAILVEMERTKFDLDEFNETDWEDGKLDNTVRWRSLNHLLNLLVEMGCIEETSPNEYTLIDSNLEGIEIPHRWKSTPTQRKVRLNNLLGFGELGPKKKDTNAVRMLLGQGLAGLRREKATERGTEILDSHLRGESPEWIKQLILDVSNHFLVATND